MTTDDLIKFFSAKNIPDLAKKSEFKLPTLYFWQNNGIPIREQAFIQLRTKGKLQADKTQIPQLKEK